MLSPVSFRTIWSLNCTRNYTYSEISVALRPFFFEVHPDKFAQHPEIRSKNEKSLQIFNGYMNDLFPVSASLQPVKVTFSIMDKSEESKAKFKSIDIRLDGTDPVRIVRAALESCELNTSELKLQEEPHTPIRRRTENGPNYTTSNIDEDFLKMYLKKKKEQKVDSLLGTLKLKREEALKKCEEVKTMRVSINYEINELKNKTRVKDIVWQMDWAETHIRRCISNVHRFMDQASRETHDHIVQALYKNVLRFGRGSFTCCDGSIQFGADHVMEQWEQTCLDHPTRKMTTNSLKRVAKELEETFGGARVLLPHFKNLAQTTTQMQTLVNRIWKKEALLIRLENAGRGTVIEVTTSYDELAIGVDGRLLVPCNVDVPSLVTFLEENGQLSIRLREKYESSSKLLESTKDKCMTELNLFDLNWENTFQPDVVSECLNRLIECSDDIKSLISGLSVIISTNPTIHVTNNGSISIPIDWK